MPTRPTIDDVARLSGVSRATVDRVLNNRKGVRQSTVERIQKAIDALSYAPSSLEKALEPVCNAVTILMPEGTNPFFYELRRGFDRALQRFAGAGIDILIKGFNPYDPASLEAALSAIDDRTDAIITAGVDTPEVRYLARDLVRKGKVLVTMVSEIPGSGQIAFIGHDNYLAGRTAGRLMANFLAGQEGSVGLLLAHARFRHFNDRISGFQQAMATDRSDIRFVLTPAYGDDPATARRVLDELFATTDDLCGVYLAGGGQPTLLEGLSDYRRPGLVAIAHEVNALSRRAILDGTLSALIAINVGEVARKALDAAILGRTDGATCGINIYIKDNLPDHDPDLPWL